jgi:metal-responsive CopG/Arc/MetJ family transcriptional regulator
MSTKKDSRKVAITFSAQLLERVDAYASRLGVSRTTVITYIVASALDSSDFLVEKTASALSAYSKDE